ncbi:hypothetical protein GDO81_007962 [Engystomops pustulosus]|uniref:Peptidase M20 dimerisation domain-containing protein n=2 Tax=Engystomops pustulosus TaxID=76066 RepID=A0AAV7CCY6_ENGPU|nr:hypothetical protein GDO81_007962 [Engystomops pustulosus]
MDVVFMAHPAQDDAAFLPDVAVHDVTVKYYGKASHAAAYPWEGINALDAAILAYNNISVLRQQMKPSWRVHGVIKHGGVKPNIIPSYSELEFYLRAPSRKDLAELQEKASACFHAAATSTGCKVELCSLTHDYYNVLPNKTLAKAYTENGKQLGMQFTSNEQVLNAVRFNRFWECYF